MISPRRSSLRAALLLAGPLLLVPVACKRPAAAPDDTTVAAAVHSRLTGDAALASEPIDSSVQAGVVTLNGTVSSNAARALAANDAAQVSGVRTVVNNLNVQVAAAPAPAEAVPTPAPEPTPAPKITPAPPTRSRDRQRHNQPSQRDRSKPADQPQFPPADQQANNIPPANPTPLPESTPPPPPPPAAPVVRNVTLPTGTILPVRVTQTLDSATAQQGDSFSGAIASDVIVEGVTVLRQGTNVSGRVSAVQEAAHFKGNSLLSIELTGVNRRGEHLTVSTEAYSTEGKGRGKNTAEKAGGGAAVGAILGGIFGGGKGAGIGAAAGGGLGAGANAITRGQQVQIPAESLVRFRLSSPVTVRVSASPEGGGSGAPAGNAAPGADQRRPLS